MFLNKIKLFLLISICLIFFFLTYNDVKSEEIKIISGIAKVTDGDTIRIKEKKIRLLGIDAPEKKQKCQKPWLTISIISFSKDYPCGQISTDKLKNKVNNNCSLTETKALVKSFKELLSLPNLNILVSLKSLKILKNLPSKLTN